MPQYSRKLAKGIRWYYKFTYEGETYFSKTIFKSQLEAKRAENQRFKDVEKDAKSTGIVDIDLLELINQRLDYVQAAKSEKYYQETKYYLGMLLNKIGNESVKSISSAIILNILIEYSKKQKQKNMDNYAVNALLRASKALFNHGIRFQKLDILNPCIGIEFFPVNKKLKYIPSDKEIEELLNLCTLEQKQLVEFVRDTGCRISEALNLRSEDIFDNYVVLYTRKSRNGDMVPRKAKYNYSKLPLPDENGKVFHYWAEEPKFLSRKTKSKWCWHNLRHRFASIHSKKGTPIFEIMSLLGHSNIETTQKYLQLLPDRS
jgi:integrase